MNDPYHIGRRPGEHSKKKKRRRKLVSFFCLLLLAGAAIGLNMLRQLKPNTQLSQAKAVVKQVSYDEATKHYEEVDFSIDLPVSWQPVPRTHTDYQSFSWQHSEKGTNGQLFQVFEDTIPVNFAVNRVQIIEPSAEGVQLRGELSDNCVEFTKGLTPAAGRTGVPAKWQGIDFLCDQNNQLRNVIGTSSVAGVNTITLTSSNTGAKHQFFFAYTNQDITPDYSAFLAALQSFRIK